MADSKNTTTTAGVLRPDELAKYVQLGRMECSESLLPWVENYWMLHWDLPDGEVFRSSMLPHPAFTLSVERGHVRDGVEHVGPVVVTGLLTRRFDVTLQESGWVFGIKFRPGGFASMTGINARLFRDVAAALPTAFDAEVVSALAHLGPHLSADECRLIADASMDAPGRSPEPAYATVLGVVAEMLNDRSLVRVGQVEDRCGISSRRLQRLFERYVGAAPKWVLARYRMHDVVSDLDAGYTGSMADLAAQYGWFDQAHFTREFTELIGVSPGAYRPAST